MDRTNGHVVSFLSLEDFAEDIITRDGLVRVNLLERSIHDWIQQWVIVTAITMDDLAMTSLLIGETLESLRDDLHPANPDRAVKLVEVYLEEKGFVTGPGVWDLGTVLSNLAVAKTRLWRFEGKKLVATDA